MKRALLTCLFLKLCANPTDPAVILGEAKFHQPSLDLLEITTSDHVVINWSDFSIGEKEITRFIQPNSNSAVVNQVLSGNPSALMGMLEANGSVFLMNPNGVLVGDNAVVKTANFMALTFNFPAEKLLNGEMPTFTAAAAGENPFASVIQHKGRIDALGTKEEGGRVFLVADKLDVRGSLKAEKVSLLGEYLLVTDEARIDSSQVRIGDTQTKQTAIGPNVQIEANEAVLWGEDATLFHGHIRAPGGFIEVSSPKYLEYRGSVDLEGGTLLLDPGDVTINTFVTSSPAFPTSPGVYDPPVAPGDLAVADLVAGLTSGNVTISTHAGSFGSGDITVLAGFTWATGTTLTFDADRDVNIFEHVQCTASGNMVVYAGRDVNVGNPTANTAFVPQALSAIDLASGSAFIEAVRDVTVRAGTTAGMIASPSEIISGSGLIGIRAGRDFQLIGSQLTPIPAGGGFAQITTSNAISIFASKNFLVQASSADNGNAEILSSADDVSAIAWGNMFILGGTGSAVPSNAILSSAADLYVSARGNMQIFAGNLGAVNITGTSSLSVFAGGNINATGFSNAALATLATTNGDLLVQSGGSIFLDHDVQVLHAGLLGGTVVAAGKDLFLTANALITTNSSDGLNLIVDNNNPSPPNIGSGRFYLGPSAAVFTNFVIGGPLRIYTATQSQNTILGLLRGTPFVPGTEFVNTSLEQWDAYFPFAFGGFPYTVFYKNLHFPSRMLIDFNTAMYEYLQNLFDFDLLEFFHLPFWISYDESAYKAVQKPKTVSSFEVVGKQNHGLLKKTTRELNGKMRNLL
ncbi:MAG: filamentous hemagglutinin N-terminal domain-containing protein [Parachlamydiales bacterium]|nr:filamentous hemagglutinin N-terminal domain-containing protein [Parachlamydiales bacterium]